MIHTTITTESAPAAIGPYSQAVRVADTVYISGQIPLLPDTGDLAGPDTDAQARQVFNNLASIAAAAGCTLADTVKLTIFLTDLQYFPLINDIMSEYFQPPFPARSTVAVKALPKGAEIEIDAILIQGPEHK